MLAAATTRRPATLDDLLSPQLAAMLDQLDLKSARLFAGKLQGERRSKARGRSVEFEDYRQYAPGDDLRHIDWNVLARLDRLFIKIFQEEQDLALHLIIDASSSMDAGTPAKLLLAQKLAMAMGYVGLVNNNRVMVTIFGGTPPTAPGSGAGRSGVVRRLEPLRSSRHVQTLARFLLDNTYSNASAGSIDSAISGATFTSVLRTVAASRAGRGVLVLLSDLLVPEGYREGLGYLGALVAGGMWDATLVQILSTGELDPLQELDGSGGRTLLGDLRLTDAETGRACEVTVSADLVQRYRARLDAYQRDLHAFASARGLNHTLVPSDADVARLMIEQLRRGGLVA